MYIRARKRNVRIEVARVYSAGKMRQTMRQNCVNSSLFVWDIASFKKCIDKIKTFENYFSNLKCL